MEIKLPSIAAQQRFIFEQQTKETIAALEKNLKAETKSGVKITDTSHLIMDKQRWKAPSAEIVREYFDNFKAQCPEYGSDKALADLLELSGDRAIRAYKEGSREISYGLWRRFLTMTGRMPQEIIPVISIFNDH